MLFRVAKEDLTCKPAAMVADLFFFKALSFFHFSNNITQKRNRLHIFEKAIFYVITSTVALA